MLNSRSFLHPFPARMAPELALNAIGELKKGSVVVDPMVGSGTVAMTAVAAGHTFYGFDLDPLSKIIAEVSCTTMDYALARSVSSRIINEAILHPKLPNELPWIESNEETENFINFWFGEKQRGALASLSYQIHLMSRYEDPIVMGAMKVALSRIIITKQSQASLARDTSHSRPHKVTDKSDYDVFKGFSNSVAKVLERHAKLTLVGKAIIQNSDARSLRTLDDGMCDALVSSPPYLNAIDYMRGHKLSLVWLNYTVLQLRNIRSSTVGAERATNETSEAIDDVMLGFGSAIPEAGRQRAMIQRFASDLIKFTAEAARILKINGKAIYVMGNSRLQGNFIDNAGALEVAASINNLRLIDRHEREIPAASRYLPTPVDLKGLGARMRTEVILKFERDA